MSYVNERGRCFWCINATKHWDEQQGTGLPLKWENRCINLVLHSFKVEDEGEHDERARQACCGQSSKSAHWKQCVASCLGLWRGHVSYFMLFILKYVSSDLIYLATLSCNNTGVLPSSFFIFYFFLKKKLTEAVIKCSCVLVLLAFSTLNFHLSGNEADDVNSEWNPWSMHQTSTCHWKMRYNGNHLYCNQGLSLFSTLDDKGEKNPPLLFARWGMMREKECFLYIKSK